MRTVTVENLSTGTRSALTLSPAGIRQIRSTGIMGGVPVRIV